jgi:hypothetical protein
LLQKEKKTFFYVRFSKIECLINIFKQINLRKMKKLIVIILCFALAGTLSAQTSKDVASTGSKTACAKFVDANNDGICDNFVDANKDGKCDNCTNASCSGNCKGNCKMGKGTNGKDCCKDMGNAKDKNCGTAANCGKCKKK